MILSVPAYPWKIILVKKNGSVINARGTLNLCQKQPALVAKRSLFRILINFTKYQGNIETLNGKENMATCNKYLRAPKAFLALSISVLFLKCGRLLASSAGMTLDLRCLRFLYVNKVIAMNANQVQEANK